MLRLFIKELQSKLRISLKESYESEYWLKLFFETEILGKKEFESLITDCMNLLNF